MSSINVPIFTISILIYMMGEFLYEKHKINEDKHFKIIIIARKGFNFLKKNTSTYILHTLKKKKKRNKLSNYKNLI